MRELRGIVRHGVLFLGDAVAAGWSRGAVYGRVRKEGWVRLGAAAWAVPGAEVDVGMRVRAVQATSPHLIASHRTAARLQSIELFAPGDELAFTDLRGANRKLRSDVKVHRCALAERETREVDDGLRVTTPLRTLTDLLRTGSLDDALTAVDSALTWRGRGDTRRPPLVRLDHLTAAAGELPHAGRRKAQDRLALADPRCESVAETIARLRMDEAGLRPESQVELAAARGRRVRVDFLFREQRVAVEIEGYAYHGSREAHVRDLGRFNALQSCPEIDTVLRFTAVQVFASPAVVIARIREALAAAA
ncbi:endonuclease domain-containing protein [Streptomyces sp. N35]|uniref:endonuclease domain-containing protein n=1 Tax=Streptomyces sp. N35 TaxID=2795730 RepID=UPI0018F4CC91|nr:hypothetical protein [Streptomyces sp. N35]